MTHLSKYVYQTTHSYSTTPTVAKEGTSTALRYNKAKVSQLQKQLADSESLRKKMLEQNSDLQVSTKYVVLKIKEHTCLSLGGCGIIKY